MSRTDKVQALIQQVSAEQAGKLSGTGYNQEGADRIEEALRPKFGDQARDIAFNLTDWSHDAATLLMMHMFPGEFSDSEIRENVETILIHAPNHLIAAAELAGEWLTDVYDLGIEIRGGERQRHTSGSPYEPVIGFSRAVRQGHTIYVSGTGPIGPDGKTVPGGAAEQARRCWAIILEAIEALGGEPQDVVRVRTYLTRTEDWEDVGRVQGEIFGDIRPAATMVVAGALLDPDWLVEIEAEAVIG